MGSSRPATGCTVVNPDFGLGCSTKGKTIAQELSLAVVFLFISVIVIYEKQSLHSMGDCFATREVHPEFIEELGLAMTEWKR